METSVFDTIQSSSEYLALLNEVVDTNRATAADELAGAIVGGNQDEKQAWCLIAHELGKLSSQLALSQQSLTRLQTLRSELERMFPHPHQPTRGFRAGGKTVQILSEGDPNRRL
jgi:hypothetical protein